jgi:hypothetical protein
VLFQQLHSVHGADEENPHDGGAAGIKKKQYFCPGAMVFEYVNKADQEREIINEYEGAKPVVIGERKEKSIEEKGSQNFGKNNVAFMVQQNKSGQQNDAGTIDTEAEYIPVTGYRASNKVDQYGADSKKKEIGKSFLDIAEVHWEQDDPLNVSL